jgi:hypothetical protein
MYFNTLQNYTFIPSLEGEELAFLLTTQFLFKLV